MYNNYGLNNQISSFDGDQIQFGNDFGQSVQNTQMSGMDSYYGYQQQMGKMQKKLERDYQKMMNMQMGLGSLENGAYYDSNRGLIVKPVDKHITPKTCEVMIAQFLSNYQIPLAQIPQFIQSSGFKFKRVDDITFDISTGKGHFNVRHICDAGITFGTYVEVPLITRDLVNLNNTQAIYEYQYNQGYSKLYMYLCELCGTVLYCYSE